MKSNLKLISFLLIIFFTILEFTTASSSESPKNANQLRNLDAKLTSENEVAGQNCNETEFPDNAKRCNFAHMNCGENNYTCKCKEGYASPTVFDVNMTYCSLEQKNQLTAFLLELFVGFGAGHFYRKAYLFASLKLAAFVFGIYVICLFPLTAKCVTDCCDSDILVVLVSIIFYLYALGLAFWYIWDLVYFGKNKYEDYTYDPHIPLKHW